MMAFRLNLFLRTSVFVVVLSLVLCSGCSRSAYRQTADRQVAEILLSKETDPRWRLPNTSIEPNFESRFYDPNDPDCPPLPPGDPAADVFMLQPSSFRGADLWHTLPEMTEIESPFWAGQFIQPEMDFNGVLLDSSAEPSIEGLTLAQAVELSLIHSREYQRQLENLYLAALNLTFERYRFQVRPLGFDGDTPGSAFGYQAGPNGASNFGLGETTIGMSRLFPGGAQLIGEFVNNTVWLVAGSGSSTSASSFAFSLVQPLMRGAGREIVLEELTQAERNVLYAVRDFARFRQQFFVSTITGGQVAGLQRFLRGFEFLGGSGAPSVGFFPVLLRLQQLRNRQYIARTLEYLIDDLKAADADQLDIARLESTLADTRGDLYGSQRVYEDNRDQYKVQLGLPPDMDVTLDDSVLKPFEFVDPTMIDLEGELRNLATELREPDANPAQIKTRFETLLGQLNGAVDLVNKDLSELDSLLPEKLAKLDTADADQLKKIISEETQRFETTAEEVQQLAVKFASIESFAPSTEWISLGDDQTENESQTGPDSGAEEDSEAEKLRREMLVLLRRMSVVQIIVRVELVPLQPFSIDMTGGVDLAMENRLDLMNRKARVTDARRNLELAADQLEANVDLVGEATISTKPLFSDNKPFDFRAKESSYGLGLRFDTPLDRMAERNNFRAAQIAYGQAKRGYIGAEDNVKLEVRQAIRTLIQLDQTLVHRQRRVQYSARELALAEAKTATAQRGLSLNSALRTLNRAQDELIEIWLDYETTRLNLFRDIGTMEIDDQGFWLDPFYQDMEYDRSDLSP